MGALKSEDKLKHRDLYGTAHLFCKRGAQFTAPITRPT